MIYIDVQTICEADYLLFVDYLLGLCDTASFHFPNFLNNDLDHILLDRYGQTNEEYVAYLQKNNELIQACLGSGAKVYVSNKYLGVKLGYGTQIVTSKLTKKLREFIKNHRLSDWVFPELPEDLCLFRNGACKLYSVSHEGQFVIQNDTPADRLFLDKHGINYVVMK